jgi:hypothetical protein
VPDLRWPFGWSGAVIVVCIILLIAVTFWYAGWDVSHSQLHWCAVIDVLSKPPTKSIDPVRAEQVAADYAALKEQIGC